MCFTAQSLIEPVEGVSGSEFNFDVVFGPGYAGDAGVGTATVPGIINEFGTLSEGQVSGAQTTPLCLPHCSSEPPHQEASRLGWTR